MKDYWVTLKDKDVRVFDEVTPDGNRIKGEICMKQNRFYGSLHITSVNGEVHDQYVQSMPKIKYYESSDDIDLDYDIIAYEKMDGSCLIIYPLIVDGEIIEIIPKTRGRAVADEHFMDLYSKIDKAGIFDYYNYNTGVLFFELYGILNQHQILHYDTGISIVLIGEYDNGFANPFRLWSLCNSYMFKVPSELYIVRKDVFDDDIHISSGWKYRYYLNEKHNSVDSVDEISDYIMDSLESLNNNYMEANNRLAVEGVVINCTNKDGHQKYIKVKPKTILDGIRNEQGVLKKDILKECRKYWDDYGSEIHSIYEKDKNHHTEYLIRMLSEDYPIEIINKSKKKIENVFMDYWKSKEVPASLHNICDELIDEYGDKGIGYCMRMFAQKYPMMKKKARMVYSVLEKRI